MVRELHIAYDREATIDDELVGCVRVSARRGRPRSSSSASSTRRATLPVARAWAVQLLVEDGAVRDFPDFYWDAIAAAEGRVIPPEPRRAAGPVRAARLGAGRAPAGSGRRSRSTRDGGTAVS